MKTNNRTLTVRVTVSDGERVFDYESASACLDDEGLRALFVHQQISSCVLICGGRSITAGPIVTWDRLKEQLVSNATTILRSLRL